MGRKKVKVQVEEPVVVATEVIEVTQEVVEPSGASVVETNLGVDPNDPRTRSDR